MYHLLPAPVLGAPLVKGPLTVVGAGISGLMLAYHARQAGQEVRVLELSQRPGGLIHTTATPHGHLEAAANGFLWCPELQQMADHLGLELLGPGPAAKARYILNRGRLSRFPLNAFEVLEAAGRMLVPRKKTFETVYDFGRTCLGRGPTEKLLDPAMGGIYGADIRQLSFPGALRVIAQAQELSPWLPVGFWRYRRQSRKANPNHPKGTHSFRGGMQVLVDALANSLGDSIAYGVDGLSSVSGEGQTVLTIPAYAAARAFEGHELGRLLAAVPYTPILSVKAIFRQESIPYYKPGFGCLVPRREGLNILGVLFNHDIFPQNTKPGYYSFTAILRDDNFGREGSLFSLSDTALLELVLREMGTFIPQTGDPEYYHIDRYERGIPLYTPQHYQNLFRMDELLRNDFPHLRLFGNYTGEISVRGMAGGSKFPARPAGGEV